MKTTIEILDACLASFKEEYLNRAKEIGDKKYALMVEEMQKGGWDLNIVAPRPTVTCGRSDYMQILAKHESYRSAFSAV